MLHFRGGSITQLDLINHDIKAKKGRKYHNSGVLYFHHVRSVCCSCLYKCNAWLAKLCVQLCPCTCCRHRSITSCTYQLCNMYFLILQDNSDIQFYRLPQGWLWDKFGGGNWLYSKGSTICYAYVDVLLCILRAPMASPAIPTHCITIVHTRYSKWL